MSSKVVFACAAGPGCERLAQAARLLMSLRWFGGSVANARFVVGCAEPMPGEASGLFRHFGADVVTIPAGDAPSHRIALLHSPAVAGHGVLVLLDPDAIVLGDPARWLGLSGTAAGVVDARGLPKAMDPLQTGADAPDPIVLQASPMNAPGGYLTAGTGPLARHLEAFNARLRASGHASLPAATDLALHAKVAANRRPKVVVGSGWWCDRFSHEWSIGAHSTRSIAFFDVWYRQVVRCLAPERIVVTDSASPIKPDHLSYPGVQWVELDRNYGHPNDVRVGKVKTKYSGFTRSVINGAMYALCCDADYYVYVEQDCLLSGDGFLARAIGSSADDILLGPPTENGRGIGGNVAAPMIQQSLMVVARSAMERFLEGLLGAPWSDGERSPEQIMRLRLAPFGFLQMPYGRSRPIDFSRSHYYAQHLVDEELARFLKHAGLELPERSFPFRAGEVEAAAEAVPTA
jgi:hypothetical protein